MAEKFAVSVTGGATSYALTHAGREIGYNFDYRNIIKELKFKVEQLEAARVDIDELIEVSRNNNEITRKGVIDWRAKVDTILEKARKLNEEATKIDASFAGFLRVSRFTVAKKSSKKVKEIQELLDQRKQFEKVGDSKPFQSLELVSFGDFEAFASREDTTNKIFKALQEKRIVGVFGMPGVGKTELMTAIAKRAKEETLFDEVVKVTVSQNPNIGSIQKDIAKQLGLQLGESSVTVAAVELSDCLKNRDKKVLVAFDDIWQRLDLNKVGIPYRRNSQSNCKVLFTTRGESVCDQMEADVKLQVGVLSEDDSLRLFRLKAGKVADSSSHREVYQEVLNECKNLPLAIVTLGLALKNKDRTVWLDARRRLQRSTYERMDPVITVIKLSYDFFHDDKAAQMCFLFCSLFPEDCAIKTDVLLSYILGEELFGKEDNMEEARNRLHAIIDKLISSGMLLRCKEDDYGNIMMHDVIRDTAISIASDPEKGEGFIVRSRLGLKEWPAIDRDMDKCRRLSLMWNPLSVLPPHQITAPLLLTLSLLGTDIEEIPSDFFKEMKNLKTLDLSDTHIISLPVSFQCLKSLHTLFMENCEELIDISLVGELEMLEILSIYSSHDVQIPVSIQKLGNLKVLNASYVDSQFPPSVISSLKWLEELYLGCRDIETEMVISEVRLLTQLTSLHICLPVECMWTVFPSDWKNLSRFSIYVGEFDYNLDHWNEFKCTRRLCLTLGSLNQNWVQSIQISNWVGLLLEKLEVLEVYDYDNFLTFEDLHANQLYSDLIHLRAWNCAQLRYLLSTVTTNPLFCNLEELDLLCLDNFVGICDGPLPAGCLSKLRVLKVQCCPEMCNLIPVDLLGNLQNLEEVRLESCEGLEELVEFDRHMSTQSPSLIFPCLRILIISGCDKLKCVLPLNSAQNLMQLEELKIMHCSDLEIVFEGDIGNADKDKAILPRLKTLALLDLPSLTSFGSLGLLYDFPALVNMGVKNCGRLERLPLLGKDSIPKLEKLDVQSGWLDGLEWEDQSLKIHLKSLPGLDDQGFYGWFH